MHSCKDYIFFLKKKKYLFGLIYKCYYLNELYKFAQKQALGRKPSIYWKLFVIV